MPIGPFLVTFLINLGASYLLGRLTARDAPKLGNQSSGTGDYGVPMPILLGEKVRLNGVWIAQDDIKETKHKVSDHSEIAGALTGAAIGFMYGGPVGTVVGAVLGGILGTATPNQHYYTYSLTFSNMVADRFGDIPIEGMLKIWANGKLIFNGTEAVVASSFDTDGRLIYRKYGKNRFFKSLTVYGGHTEQPVDPVLAAAIDEDGAYPFIAHAVFEDLQLADTGNSPPNPLEFLVQVHTGQTVASASEFVCSRAGIDNTRDMSSTILVDKILRGYGILQESTCWDAIKPILPVFGVDCAEVGGQLRFYERSQSLRATIPSDEMGAYVYGDSLPAKYTFNRDPDLKLPQETSLTFLDPARDYQENTASSSRTEGSASSNVSVSIPIVMTADEGASAAALMHWDAWLGRSSLNFSLTDTWIGLETGLAYAIPVVDQFVPYRITRRTRGANGIIEVEALSDESVTYSANIAGTSGTVPDEPSTAIAETRLVLIDGPITSDDHDDYGFYVLTSGSEAYWDTGEVDASSDGVNFATLFFTSQSAIVGDVTGTLAAGTTTGLDDTLDTTTVLTVVLLHDAMELEDATDAELDTWKNFAFVGKGTGEYIQWKTATKIAPKTWELTNLRRGRKGTDWAITEHASGEEFAVLGEDGFYRINYNDTTQWGDTVTFRGVTLHEDPADADTQTFINTGEGKRPYSPVNVMGSWDGSNNLTIAWDARSRLNAGGLGIDDQDNYEVEIITGAGRTITATGVETADYPAADQTSDGITPGDSITGRVRQLSDVNDGRWRDFFLPGPGATLLHEEDDTTPLHLEDGLTPFELG